MSYVPKYVLKRMIPKDSLNIKGEELEVTFTNLFMDLPVAEIPNYVGKLLDVLEIKINDEIVIDSSHADTAAKCKLIFEEKEFGFDNLHEAGHIPVNAEIKFLMPNIKGLKPGETIKFQLSVQIQAMPIDVSFEREVFQV